MLVVRYKPAYAVTFKNEVIGYVENKDEFQELIDNDILKPEGDNVAFVALENVDYSLKFVSRELIDSESILSELKSNSKNIYEVFEVSSGEDENQENVFFNTENEANDYIDSLEEEYEKIDPDLKITTLYVEDEVTEESIQEAKAKITEKLDEQLKEKEEEEKIESQTVNGVYLACLPVTGGTITSRFGVNESVRNHTHKGLDIGASYGTSIVAAANGTVKSASYSGGYGNLVIIDHGNGVETYYAHCSQITVSAGQTVEAGDLIARVGSTGSSTGNHCHFEVRVNGSQVNPQNYLYK